MSQVGIAEKLCRLAFSWPFNGLIVVRQVDFPMKFQMIWTF